MGWVVNATPRPLYPRGRPGTHCIGGWVGPRAGLDRCGKSRFHRDSIPGTVQPIASRYIDYDILTPYTRNNSDIITIAKDIYPLAKTTPHLPPAVT